MISQHASSLDWIVSLLIPFLISSSIVFSPLVTAICYQQDGQSFTSLAYQPCDSRAGVTSFCCATNRTADPGKASTNVKDICLQNGLCQYIITNDTEPGGLSYSYFREGCSDPNRPKGSCLQDVCTSDDDEDQNRNAEMTPCDNTPSSEQWCCGRNNTACCNTDKAITLAKVLGQTDPSTAPTGSNTTNTTTPSTPPPKAASSGLSTGAKAGIGAGVGVAALFLLVAVATKIVRMKQSRAREPPSYTPKDVSQFLDHRGSPDQTSEAGRGYFVDMEMDRRVRVVSPAELPANVK